MRIGESYSPVIMSATGYVSDRRCQIAGFACSATGTLVLRDGGASGTVVLASMPVTAGVWHPLPFRFHSDCHATLGSGATGTFGII